MSTTVSTNKFSWLLKREFWEYRGAFFWTPVITSIVMLSLVLLALIIAENDHGLRGNFGELLRQLIDGRSAARVALSAHFNRDLFGETRRAFLQQSLVVIGFPAIPMRLVFAIGLGAQIPLLRRRR